MNRILLGALILAASGLACLGQTHSSVTAIRPLPPPALNPSRELAQNSAVAPRAATATTPSQIQDAPIPPGHVFPLPELKWQDLPFRQEAVAASSAPQPVGFSRSRNSELSASDTATFDRIEREGLLRPPVQTFDSEIARKISRAFEPKIIHIGHVEIYSSIVNAIARKNPLCLLDPMVVNVSF
jgi:hypothetical protein